ncbi:hypothetical protein L2E82_29381 [Cichorium intybus]|uniref:Uncharacterized protein n=1 Tax=Cichorium intybus TaxID=13427 RepID=A0ACB9CXT0_CICIN|nr:hypothetical protein L2E82_29381 [Cichorium intybus]
MSTRMLIDQAAWNGDVDHLLKELDNNPTTLHAITLEGGESPLHITCFAGQVNLVGGFIEVRHDFSRELNQDGFTHLHIAAACGKAEIVKKLLKLLLASLDSVKWKTAQHETCLHLAVKNHQFEALQVLIQHLKQSNKEDYLNSKDIYGNIILHVVVSKKQFEVINFILNRQITSKENIELNALNNSGLTPLDMLLMFQSEAGDREIEEILILHYNKSDL